MKIRTITFIVFCLVLVGVSILAGIQLSYVLPGLQSTGSNTSIRYATLDFNPVMIKVVWNTSKISEYNQWIQVNQTITNVGSSPVNVPSGYAYEMWVIAPNGSRIDDIFVPGGSAGTPFRIDLNQSQTVTVTYNVIFTKSGIGGRALQGVMGSTIYYDEYGLTPGLYTLDDIIYYPSGPANDQYQIVAIPLNLEI